MPLAKAARSRVVAVVSSVIILLSGQTRRPLKLLLSARCPPAIGVGRGDSVGRTVADLCGYDPFYHGHSDRMSAPAAYGKRPKRRESSGSPGSPVLYPSLPRMARAMSGM